jgi:RES domain-containing protein
LGGVGQKAAPLSAARPTVGNSEAANVLVLDRLVGTRVRLSETRADKYADKLPSETSRLARVPTAYNFVGEAIAKGDMPRLSQTLIDHPDSARISQAIRACSSLASRFTGETFRATSYEWASAHNLLDGVGSLKYGGRWNPPGLFKVVYLSCDPETATAESLATNRRNGLPDSESLPLVIIGVRVELARLFDVTHTDVQKRLGVTTSDLTVETSDRSRRETMPQAIGRLARADGYEGLLVPSAARPGALNIVVFLGRLTARKVQLINAEMLPKWKRPSSRKSSRKSS